MSEKVIFINELPPRTRKMLADHVKYSAILTVKEWVTAADSFGVNRQEYCDLMMYQMKKILENSDINKAKALKITELESAVRNMLKEGERNG